MISRNMFHKCNKLSPIFLIHNKYNLKNFFQISNSLTLRMISISKFPQCINKSLIFYSNISRYFFSMQSRPNQKVDNFYSTQYSQEFSSKARPNNNNHDQEPELNKVTQKSQNNQSYKDQNVNDLGDEFAKHMQEDYKEPINYSYTNKIVYSLNMEESPIRHGINHLIIWTNIWVALSYLTYIFIHPWGVIIPAWFLSGSLTKLFLSWKFRKASIARMELIDKEHVKMHNLWGNDIIAHIEDIEYVGMKEINENINKNIEKKEKSYIAVINFSDNKERIYSQMKFLINSTTTIIENIDLFKSILYSDLNELEKFIYVKNSKDQHTSNEGTSEDKENFNAKSECKNEDIDNNKTSAQNNNKKYPEQSRKK